jgi:hypothetical protein
VVRERENRERDERVGEEISDAYSIRGIYSLKVFKISNLPVTDSKSNWMAETICICIFIIIFFF